MARRLPNGLLRERKRGVDKYAREACVVNLAPGTRRCLPSTWHVERATSCSVRYILSKGRLKPPAPRLQFITGLSQKKRAILRAAGLCKRTHCFGFEFESASWR